MAKVSCSLSMKINLGNYESLGIDIGVEDEKRPDETMKEAHERVFNFVNHRLQEKVKTVREELEEIEGQGGY